MRSLRPWGLLLLIGAAAACSMMQRQPRVRNLIILSLDTLRSDHTGMYGLARGASPHLDRLSRESILMTQMRSHAPETRDSHMAMFTSQYTFVHRRVGALPTLAEQLQSMEFATAGFTDGGEMSHAFGFDRGFEIYTDNGGGLDHHLGALETWLDTRKPGRFFAFLHTYEVHDPYDPGPPYSTMYHPDYTGTVSGEISQNILRAIRQIGQFRHGGYEKPVLSDDDKRKMVALYNGDLRKTDEAVGRLYQLMQRRGLLDDTVLVIVSDHGEEFWEHGSVLHSHTLYNELLSVVGVVRLPKGQQGGTLRRSTVQGIDLTPTLLEMLGCPPLPTAAGAALDLSVEEEQERAWYADKRSNFSLNLGRYKYIGEIELPDKYEMYDLAQDPGEKQPLRDPALRERLLSEIAKVRGKIKEDLVKFRPAYPVASPVPLDEQTLEQLRQLGYIE